jgi:hypothetical protein
LTTYLVYLKTADEPVPVSAHKFACDENGNTVFYVRSKKDEPFEEAARFLTSSIKRIKED